MDWIGALGWGAVGVLVLSWIAVSFSQPGPRRARLEWIAATALFLALAALFAHLVGRALAEHSRIGLAGFGLLLVIFLSGLVVSAVQTVLSWRGERKTGPSATN